jgi:septum formation topological specificity factor MinE
MATALPLPTTRSRWARSPFYFNSAAHLLRVGREKACNLQELLEALRACPDSSIFQHTFQTLAEHHFIQEGFSNDFAHWAFSACNEVGLAERLAAIDVREFTSIATLRERLLRIIEEYLQKNPRAVTRAAMEPFYLMASDLVVVPTPYVARNLEEFSEGLRRVSIHAIYYHFIDARLRLKLNTNDFSVWLEHDMEMAQAADRLNRIDIYTSTLEGVRRDIMKVIELESQRFNVHAVGEVLNER